MSYYKKKKKKKGYFRKGKWVKPHSQRYNFRKKEPISKRKAKKRQASRSKRARTMDNKKRAKNTFQDPNTLWSEDPGRYDVDGLDTPESPRLRKKKVTEGTKVLIELAVLDGDIKELEKYLTKEERFKDEFPKRVEGYTDEVLEIILTTLDEYEDTREFPKDKQEAKELRKKIMKVIEPYLKQTDGIKGNKDSSLENKRREEKTIDVLENAGGDLWEKYGKRRVYFNEYELARHLGYKWDIYGSGNISNATLNGEKISNTQMREILDELRYSRLYYDLKGDQFNWEEGNSEAFYVKNAVKVLEKSLTSDKSSTEKGDNIPLKKYPKKTYISLDEGELLPDDLHGIQKIEGETYFHRNELKQEGFTWNPDQKAWMRSSYKELPTKDRQQIKKDLDSLSLENKKITIDKKQSYNETVNSIRDKVSKREPKFFDYFEITVTRVPDSLKKEGYKPDVLVSVKNEQEIINIFEGDIDPTIYAYKLQAEIEDALKYEKIN